MNVFTFYMSWLTGAFLSEFAPEWTVSYLIAMEKPNGGIRGIAPVDIYRRTMGNAVVQEVQPIAVKVCIETVKLSEFQTADPVKRWCFPLPILSEYHIL